MLSLNDSFGACHHLEVAPIWCLSPLLTTIKNKKVSKKVFWSKIWEHKEIRIRLYVKLEIIDLPKQGEIKDALFQDTVARDAH